MASWVELGSPPSSQALWRTLHNPDDSVATVAFRVLGKFGGSNRKMLNTAQPVSHTHQLSFLLDSSQSLLTVPSPADIFNLCVCLQLSYKESLAESPAVCAMYPNTESPIDIPIGLVCVCGVPMYVWWLLGYVMLGH